jgi:hypothetical protein
MRMLRGTEIRRNGQRVMIVLTLWCILLVTGSCEKPPTEEFIRAERTLGEAYKYKAHLYSPDFCRKAEDSLQRARSLVKGGQYKDARKEALRATTYAQQALASVETSREEYRVNSSQILSHMEERVAELKQRVEGIKAKKRRARLNALTAPTLEQWTFEIQSLRQRLLKEEPHDVHRAIDEAQRAFEKEYKTLSDGVRRRR